MKHFDKKKIVVLGVMLAMIVCIGAINNKLTKDNSLSASAGYQEYEEGQLLNHDGEVLVDSINVQAIPGESKKKSSGSAVSLSSTAIVTSDNVEELENADTYFEEVRATISMDRNEIISMLSDVIEQSPEGTEKNNATQQKLKIIDYMNQENEMESLIENKGFTEALVILTDTSVNVTVKKQELNQTDLAKIMDIAIRETGRKADEIVIQSKF